MKKVEQKNASLLVSSSAISKIGDVLFDYVNNSFLASLNMNSMVLVGVYQSLENIMGVLFNLFGGVIADRFRRKKIIILSDFLSGLACIALSFISDNTWLIYAIIAANVFLAFLSSFSTPAYNAFTKEVVEKDNIALLNSYLQTAATVVKIVIPIVAVGVYRLIGIHGALLMDGVSFILSSIIVAFVSPILEENTKNSHFSMASIFQDLISGFRYLAQKRQVSVLIALSASVNFFMAAYNLLLPYSNQMFPKITENIYGTFLTAEAVGGLIGALISGRINKKLSTDLLMTFLAVAGLFLGLAPILYHIFPNVVFLALSPAFCSIFLTVFNIHSFSLVQREVDSDYLGRVLGIVFTIAVLFMPLGTAIFTIILRPDYEFNYLFVGLAVIILSFIFLMLLRKTNDKE